MLCGFPGWRRIGWHTYGVPRSHVIFLISTQNLSLTFLKCDVKVMCDQYTRNNGLKKLELNRVDILTDYDCDFPIKLKFVLHMFYGL